MVRGEIRGVPSRQQVQCGRSSQAALPVQTYLNPCVSSGTGTAPGRRRAEGSSTVSSALPRALETAAFASYVSIGAC
jgi:hypothetical protein